ncbi:unnamed protein product [Sphagnum jensenii]|uniref:Uncharacterized protein n=1 Tax=Sphagnum jensenii TaxID=128206 RepID=A0ABP1A155_9BRYO
MECTILAHIDIGSSALSVQNKRHLHWKALERIPSMNNEIEFAIAAHNLLRKMDAGDTNRQVHKNHAANILASPQAAFAKSIEFWQGNSFWNEGIPMGRSKRTSAGTAILVDKAIAPLITAHGILTKGHA